MRQNLDRYVGRTVVGSVAASLLFFAFLSILLDLLRNLGSYLDQADEAQRAAERAAGQQDDGRGATTLELFGFLAVYYVKLLPVLFVQVAPFATVIGSMFGIARLMGANELQPMLFIGRSMPRILRPTLVVGAVVGLAMVASWQWVVPGVADDVGSLQTFLTGGKSALENLVLEQRSESFFMRIGEYDPRQRRMTDVALLRGTQPEDAVLILGKAARWDDAIGDWRLEGGVRRTGDGEQPCEILGAPEWTPDIVQQRGQERVSCELLSYTALLETRLLRPNRKDVVMALHRHVTYPLANLILLLLALPFAIHFERGSRTERVLSAIGICGAYLLFDLTCQNLGFGGYLHPVVAAWSPTILFGSLGIVLFGGMRT